MSATPHEAIDPAAPRSAFLMHLAVPGRKHPVEIVLSALLAGRTVRLAGGASYRIGAGPTCPGVLDAASLPVGELRGMSEALSFNDLFLIGCDTALAGLAASRRRRGGGRAAAKA